MARGVSLSLDERVALIKAHIDRHWKGKGCALCGSNEWSLADDYTRLELSRFGVTPTIGQRALPCIALVCSTCGNTVLLNLRILGIEHG